MRWGQWLMSTVQLCVAGGLALAQVPAPVLRGRAVIGGAQIAYESRGSLGAASVVLIHGGLVDCRLWDPQVDALVEAGLRVIRYDLRGFGRSTQGSGEFSHVDDLHRLLDQLELPQVSLVGLSLGGMIAADFALEHPERVERLVLISSGLRGAPDLPDPAAQEIYRTALKGQREAAVGLWMQHPLLGVDNEGPASTEAVALLRRMVGDNFANWSDLSRFKRIRWPGAPTAERLSELRVPTLVVHGRSDTATIQAAAQQLAAALPHVRPIAFSGLHHHLNLERPAAVNDLLIDYLVTPREELLAPDSAIDDRLKRTVDFDGDGAVDSLSLQLNAAALRAPFRWRLQVEIKGKEVLRIDRDDAGIDERFWGGVDAYADCAGYVACKTRYYYSELLGRAALTLDPVATGDPLITRGSGRSIYETVGSFLLHDAAQSPERAELMLEALELRLRSRGATLLRLSWSPESDEPPQVYVPELQRFVPIGELP